MDRTKDYFGIFNSWDRIDDAIRQETRELLAEANKMSEGEISEEWISESIMDRIRDEKVNLDIETDGFIIALGNVGLWYGHRTGYMEIGTNVTDIFSKTYGGEEYEFYADRYNVRCRAVIMTAQISYFFACVRTRMMLSVSAI